MVEQWDCEMGEGWGSRVVVLIMGWSINQVEARYATGYAIIGWLSNSGMRLIGVFRSDYRGRVWSLKEAASERGLVCDVARGRERIAKSGGGVYGHS